MTPLVTHNAMPSIATPTWDTQVAPKHKMAAPATPKPATTTKSENFPAIPLPKTNGLRRFASPHSTENPTSSISNSAKTLATTKPANACNTLSPLTFSLVYARVCPPSNAFFLRRGLLKPLPNSTHRLNALSHRILAQRIASQNEIKRK